MTEKRGAPVDKAALLKDLRKQVTVLEDDLRARTDSVDEFRADLEREYEAARESKRTAATYGAWRDERVTQAAAGWVLATVFVRFCEDNGLIEDPYIAGPGERLADAEDRQAAFFREHPELNDRDWLVAGFESLAGSHEAVAGLFERRHNPLWELSPSYEAATRLLGFWRERGADGEIVHVFADDELDTRFLGDLYQDLSEHARKTYALLQTPEFVEEFILDLTLEPAVEEFGLDPAWKHKPVGWKGDDPIVRGLRCIDPACGSGHFLLGMFSRLLEKWRAAEPGTDDWELVRRSLESVHGCDKNPFAVAIARFRLLVAALKACGERRLSAAPAFPINVAVGDSLLHGRGVESVTETLFGDEEGMFAYRTEDVREYVEKVDLLGRGTYHVVVGNPPYITVKDKQENENYRKAYDACAGTYALSVPFVQRIFELAVRGKGMQPAGFTGQITANSFMKREFGKKLIEEYFVSGRVGVTLTHVVDTSGAYIPGHGTPTVILAGRNSLPSEKGVIRAVLGVRGEPDQPSVASEGLVWQAIREQIGRPGSESEWVSVADAPWMTYTKHPWSLSGGGAGELAERITRSCRPLRTRIETPIGRAIRAGADEAFMRPLRPTLRTVLDRRALRPLMIGEVVRDWAAGPMDGIWYPYDPDVDSEAIAAELFPWRTLLAARRTFQGDMEAAGLRWWEYMQHTASAYVSPLSITFAEVATHNHFVLDRGGSVFKQTSPVIKLPEGATEEGHVALLGLLNSSVACFWLKQTCFCKGNATASSGMADQPWSWNYQFGSTKIAELPLPGELPLRIGSAVSAAAHALREHAPSAVASRGIPVGADLREASVTYARIRAQMIALQEELDWTVYGLYDLLTAEEVARTTLASVADVPELTLGERAFEIVLARKVAAGEAETAWFERHGSTPVTEIPAHWPEEYKAVVQARIDIINSRKDIALIERPECKRRWASEPWEKKEKEALRTWLLDRCEDENLWFGLRDGFRAPRTLTVSQLADALRQDADVQAVAELYAADHMGKRDATLATVLADVIASEHVPYLAAMRYKDSGLRKRAQWEQVWDLQREEDKTGERLDIPVPPKYSSSDFLKTSYWSHRGKLDVPKERFISYPDASPDSDSSILLGWAGWDHKDQVQALVNVINDRTEQAGWDTPRLTPLVAGIQELMPWVHQWHGQHDDEWGGTPSEEYQAYLDEQRAKHGLSAEDLTAWRPVKKAGGRAKKSD
ncbi:BREX-2 system adenine-specific DNA-methyltransferase PglX [Streptomyces solicathayae]|uniref:site-specific DNA-methyltransferase (adenine-specific) n=1 Tax=Streptomyces solicathayae TaxID=3081768 RepID=A0ABZ0LPK2_9ACTN|nr:BREX-2 system adenine-specific DNA-methyltransferase PglX [Streptomyces sp. HUAS YS2]WOX21230.1 BREX-2 system adenine-specific DNA-methyltransferase PglX [Streptomyces sp. HUAS YS2]